MKYKILLLFSFLMLFSSFGMAKKFNSCSEKWDYYRGLGYTHHKLISSISRLYEHRESRDLIQEKDLSRVLKFYNKYVNRGRFKLIKFTGFVNRLGEYNEVAYKTNNCYMLSRNSLRYNFSYCRTRYDIMKIDIENYRNLKKIQEEKQKGLDKWMNPGMGQPVKLDS